MQMAVYIGRTVVHIAKASERGGVGETACGIRFSLSDPGYDPNGAWSDDGYLEWIERELGLQRCFCSHCPNREPPWKRRKRQAVRPIPNP